MTDQETAQRFADILQDAILEIDPTIHFRWQRMFGGAGYYADDRMFAAWFREHNVALKLSEAMGDDLLQIADAHRATRHYVAVPTAFLTDIPALAVWVARSIEYVQSQPLNKR